MNNKNLHNFLKITIAIVWLVNGLYCKILNFAPRHQEIVARILGDEYAPMITNTIGILEILMMGWVLSAYKSKLNAIAQITIVLSMNILEAILAKDLLLFGYGNFIFAILFSAVIYFNEYHIKEKYAQS